MALIGVVFFCWIHNWTQAVLLVTGPRPPACGDEGLRSRAQVFHKLQMAVLGGVLTHMYLARVLPLSWSCLKW